MLNYSLSEQIAELKLILLHCHPIVKLFWIIPYPKNINRSIAYLNTLRSKFSGTRFWNLSSPKLSFNLYAKQYVRTATAINLN